MKIFNLNNNLFAPLFLLFFLYSTHGISQNIDSLLQIVDTLSSPVEKGDVLLDIAWEYHDVKDPNSAYKYAEMAIDLFDQLDSLTKKSSAIRDLGWLYARNDEFITAEETFNDALALLISIDEPKLEADLYKNLGNMYNRYMPITEDNLNKGRDAFDKAFEIRNRMKDYKNLSYDYFNLAQGYDVHSRVNKTLEYYYKAIEILRDKKYSPNNKNNSLAAAYANSGWSYEKAEETDLAIEYFKRALYHLPDDVNKSNNAIMLNHLSTLYEKKKQIRKSFKCIYQSLNIGRDIKNQKRIASAFYQLSELHRENGDIDSAFYYSKKCLELNEFTSSAHETTGFNYLKINKIDSAMYHFNYNILNETENALEEYLGLSQCLEIKGDFQGALLALRTYNFKNDSIKKIKRIPALNLSETKQEQELALNEKLKAERLEKDAIKSRNFLQYSGAFFLIILLFLVVNMTLRLNFPKIVIQGFAFITVVTLFEFSLVYFDSVIENLTGGIPVQKLGINVAIAALIFPIHNFIAKRMNR